MDLNFWDHFGRIKPEHITVLHIWGTAKMKENLGPVVQSIISLTSSLRDQLVKCFTTLLPNTLIFFIEQIREAFALQKLFTFFFNKKILAYLRY